MNPKTLLLMLFSAVARKAVLQLALLCGTFLAIATLLDGAYAMLAGQLRPWLRDRRRALAANRLAGSCLIAAALGLGLARRQ